MGRRNQGQDTQVYELFLIGEQIRCQMRDQGFIKDRRYHLRKHKKCFVAKDTIDWLVRMCHVQVREEAVRAMQVLKDIGFIRHVSDDHDFKDQNLLYRFTHDDDTYKVNKDLTSFYRGLEIYQSLTSPGKSTNSVMRDFYHLGYLYTEAFHGCDVIDFLQAKEGIQERDILVFQMRELLERGLVKHVTDDYHFSDDRLIYEFSIDFNKASVLLDVLDIESERKPVSKVKGHRLTPATQDGARVNGHTAPSSTATANPTQPAHSQSQHTSDDDDDDVVDDDGDEEDEEDEDQAIDTIDCRLGRSSAWRQLNATRTLEYQNSSNVQRTFTVVPDKVGYGFAIHGCSPCRIQRVDPLGPAAAAGLKINQSVIFLNGQDVSRMDHLKIRQLLATKYGSLELRVTAMSASQSQRHGSRKKSYCDT